MPGMTKIHQGEDLEFRFHLDGEDITGWICTMLVKRFPKDDPIIERVIPPREIKRDWPGFLTSTETAALDLSSVSPYWIIGVLTNSSTNQQRQIPRRFHIDESWV